ncbi:MAG: hypothetical protein M3347_17875, partial [Armatimonadota bacterium]|nr:hypothetical protein [Armatimonadota bacterium]
NLKANGEFSLDVKGAALSGPTATDGLSLAGFTLRTAAMDLALARPGPGGKSFGLSVNFPTVTLSTPVPNLLTQDDAPLTLKATNVKIDETGMPSFDTAALARLPGAPPVSYAGPASPPPGSPQVIRLAQPMDFVLTVTNAEVGFKNGVFTKFGVTANVALPPDIKDEKGDRVELKNLSLDVKNGVAINVGQPLDLHWNTFALHVSGGVALDLSPAAAASGLPAGAPGAVKEPKWQGVFVTKANLDLPDALKKSGGQKAAVSVDNFFVDGQGITGAMEVKPGTLAGINLMGFNANFTGGGIEFKRSKLVAGRILGDINLPVLNEKLGIGLSISTAGLVQVDVDTARPIAVDKFGAKLALTAGSLKVQPGQTTRILLTGSLSFPAIKEISNSALQFTDLGIGTDGKFYTGGKDNWLTLVHPAKVDLGLFAVNVSQVGLGDNSITLTGGVKLADDLPLTGEVTFKGLQISAGPKLAIGGLDVKFKAMGVATIQGAIERKSIPIAGGKMLDCLYGDVSVYLDFAGPTQGMGGDLHLMIADGAWAVFGKAVLPEGTNIPLGPTGLGIIGFYGGLGHNVKLRDGLNGPPTVSTDVVPHMNGGFLFLAGVKISTADGRTLGGDLILTVGYPPLLIDFTGKIYILDNIRAPSGDRTGTLSLRWDGANSAFRAAIDADMYFPNKSVNLYHASGGIELYLSPDQQHLFIGWPMDVRAIQVEVLKGFVTVQGGVGIEIKPQRYIKAGFLWKQEFLGILKGQIDGALDINFDEERVRGMLHAYGEV